METRAADIVRDEAFLPKYRKAGIVHVYVGLEATEQETLDKIEKGSSVEEGRESLRLIREHGMLSETSFVLGFPDETEETRPADPENGPRLRPRHGPLPGHHPLALLRPLQRHQGLHRGHRLLQVQPDRAHHRPAKMSLREIDEAIIRCYRDFYMPKMADFRKFPDTFRRDYMLSSMKLIMKSSFIVEKLGRLGIPEAMRKIIAAAGES